ncbi:hypothetical protein BOX15_Mlig029775g1 [Macrostomum lignano]|uniref:Protein-lysine N-methyltransferase BOX15_Mlig029775g1 n=1 Tax=Macrostomum lignano TaxID=282301 RepID=A0A267FZ15_9PLAT|nr:hypothetical protein BOX15_Mlig029775g1 [Macrostomum lignano]
MSSKALEMLANEIVEDSDDDDVPQLSAHALAALEEFYTDQHQQEKSESVQPAEDWNLSQFWYNEATCETLATEVEACCREQSPNSPSEVIVAFVSCPTLYLHVRKLRLNKQQSVDNLHLLEFDTRFASWDDSYQSRLNFHRYDYREPEKLPANLLGKCSLVIADPPFLSEECLRFTAFSIQRLICSNSGRLILCTGAVQEDLAAKYLNASRRQFKPGHANRLSNEFACFTNYSTFTFE